MAYFGLFCPICGMQIFNPDELEGNCALEACERVPDPFEHEKWLTRAVLLTTGRKYGREISIDLYSAFTSGPTAQRETSRTVLELPAVCRGSDTPAAFELLGRNEDVVANSLPALHDARMDGPLYIPLHESCLLIAKKVIHARDRDGYWRESTAALTSMDRLWHILKDRLAACKEGGELPTGDGPLLRIYDPRRFYMAFLQEDGSRAEYECPTDEEYVFENPCHIPSITNSIVENLVLQKTESTKICQPVSSIKASLPQEILDLIMLQLQGLTDSPVEPTFLLPQRFWRQALEQCQLLPWLWDISVEDIAHKEASKPHNGEYEWNWELLVRQLAQSNLFEEGKHPRDLASGIRNRRRIWRILEEMREGDLWPQKRR